MIHLVCAEDELLAEELVEQLLSSDAPAGDTEIIQLTAEPGDVPGLYEPLFAGSLFATDRRVVISAAERLLAGGVKRLAEALSRPTEASTIVVAAVSDRPPAALLKALQTRAKVHRVSRPRRGELVGWISRRLRRAGVSAEPEVAGMLVEALGQSLRELSQAADQLALRVGAGGTVRPEDVAVHFPTLAEQPVWALYDALVARDMQQAFHVLHASLSSGNDPLGVLFGLVSQNRLVMRAKSATERSASLSDQRLGQAIGSSPARAGVVRRQAARVSWTWLTQVHRLSAEADFEMKGGDEVRVTGVLPPVTVLERVVAGCLPEPPAPGR